MPSVISIVGKSESGKTTLLELLIGELKGRGYRIAAIKHTNHELTIDQSGKDSWRLSQAGSDVVVLSSAGKLALFKQVDHKMTPQELAHLVGEGVDLILIEGFKEGDTLKIEVHRKELGELVCSPEELIAIVTDEPITTTVPQFSHSDVKALADFIEKMILPAKDEVSLMVNGAPLHLGHFTKDIITRTLLGMVSALKGADKIKTLQIWLKKSED